jgi:two-component system nitrogen regulation sensor histidine kinase NtrY
VTTRVATIALVVVAAFSLLALAFIVQQLSVVSVGLAANDAVERELRRSLDDQKRLARLDPPSAGAHRQHFDAIVTLIGHLRVVQDNRRETEREVEKMLFGVLSIVLASGIALYLFERRDRERRLVRLEAGVAALSRGDSEIALGETRKDVIGRIATTVERSARDAAHDRQRLRYLEHLSAWQEAARRHAHEMRTPLTAARMDVERLTSTIQQQLPSLTPEIEAARQSLFEELDRLREFTRSFTSFATIPKPRLRTLDLHQFVADFCTSFAPAWPDITLIVSDAPPVPALVSADGEMLRQVLVNLTTNSALAMRETGGTVRFTTSVRGGERPVVVLEVSDSGPGIAPEIRKRLFEPYTTTRSIGEGMGLGLAISRKILIDHRGDLDLIDSEARGAAFRLTLPGWEGA